MAPANGPWATSICWCTVRIAQRHERALLSLDYVRGVRHATSRVFDAAQTRAATMVGEHPDNPIKIEAARAIAEFLPVRTVDITRNASRAPRRD